MTDEIRRAAEGQDGAFAHAARAADERDRQPSKKERRRAERAAAEAAAAAAQPPVDPVAAAQDLIARSGEIDTSYGAFHAKRDVALRREQECLRVYRELYHRHRNRLNDTRWCATPEGTQVVAALSALRDEVDRLSQIKPDDVDYQILWAARIAVYHADFVQCVLAAAQPIVSAHGRAEPILVAIDGGQEEALRTQGARDKFFFRAERQTFYPNGYKQRVEVQRVVRELQQLWRRTMLSFKHERERTVELLRLHAPDRVDAAGTAIDLVRLLSIAEASPYEGRVDVALYLGGFKFVPPGEMQEQRHRGVVHLSVENGTDSETGGPAKLLTVCEVVGQLERTLPAAGVCWSIALGRDGNGELGLRKGWNRPEDQQPIAVLRHLQQELFEASRHARTVGQALGLEAYQAYEERRRGKRRPPAVSQQTRDAQGAAAGGAPAEAGGAETAPQGSRRNRRSRKPRASTAGGNGVPKPGDAAATPAAETASEPPTDDTSTS